MAERIDYDVLVGLFLLNEQYDEATAVLADITDDSTRARLESRVLNAKRRRLSTQPPPPVQKQEKAGAAVTTTTTEETAAVASAAAPGAIPQPLEVKLVGGDPKGLPDQLPATLSNADLEKNPDLLPYNSPFNDAYSRKMTFKNVKGQEAVQQLFERTLVAPSVVPGLFDSSSGGIGALLYGVAGTGKTTIATAAVNLLCSTDGIGGCEDWSETSQIYRSQDACRVLDESTELKGWVKRHFWKDGHYEMPKVVAFFISGAYIKKPLVGEAERTLSRYFEMARKVQPTILFFDEADDWLDESVQTNSGAINTFKQLTTADNNLDPKPVVYSIVASNFPDRLGEAIVSRFGGGIVEVGLPNEAARKALLRYEITKQLKVSNWRGQKSDNGGGPVVWIADTESTLAALAKKTRPPFNAGELEAGVFKLWSGRDISKMVSTVINAAKTRVMTSTTLSHCTAQGKPAACNNYDPSDTDIYIEDSRGGTIRAADLIARKEGYKIRASPITFKDFDDAWPTLSTTVSKEAVRSQILFNKKLGKQPNPASPGQKLADMMFGGYIGPNSTIPDD